jgi:hypothetical protein
MKRVLPIILIALMICSFASAEMIITQQPNKVYNLGDSVSVPVTVKTIAGVSGVFTMDILCGTKDVNFYKNGVNLIAGEEKTMDASLALTKEVLGESLGTCKIKGMLGQEYILTNDFKISNLLTLQPNTETTDFDPGQSITLSGDVVKENGQLANGFMDLEILIANSSKDNIAQKGTMNNGMYSLNVQLPEKMKAGKYLVKINAYEVAFDGSQTNKGFINYNIKIKQVPTSLQIIIKDENVEPGTNVDVKTILHDQTGEAIDSTSIITIKRGGTEVVEGGGPTEKPTGEYLSLPIAYNEPPGNWTVSATSNQLSAEAYFTITAKEAIKAEIVNETIIITNMGNVPYNGTITIKMGNESKEYPIYLNVSGKKEYSLSAPKGEYEIEVLDKNGESKVKDSITITRSPLTGNAIRIRDSSEVGLMKLLTRPLIWILALIIILAAAFIIIRNIRKKRKETGVTPNKGSLKKIIKKNLSKEPLKNIPWENRAMPLSKESKLETKNKANFSPSIKGNKQDISLVNVTIKNLAQVQANRGNPEEPLQKIINLAENKKAFVYESQSSVFFILTPSKTRTFKNEPTALEIAQEAKEILSSYNRVAKHRLDFGISIEQGSIVEKTENGIMDFVSLGTLMSNSKKIAAASEGEVLLGERIKEKLTNVRTEKQDNGRITFYKIKDIKYYESGHSRYMDNFLAKARENKGVAGVNTDNFDINKNTNNNPDNNKDNPSKDPKSLIKGFY